MDEKINCPLRKKRTPTVPLTVGLIVLSIACIAAYAMISWFKPWDPAEYLPKDVAVAVTLDLTPSSDKQAALEHIQRLFRKAGINNPEDDLLKELDKSLGINFINDVIPHINGRGAAAVLTQMAGSTPEIVVIIGTRSNKNAKTLMSTIGDSLNSHKIGFERLQYKGNYYYRIPNKSSEVAYVGAVKRGIIYSNSKDGFNKVVDTANGKPNLLQDDTFVRMRKTSSKTFATTYYSGSGYCKLISPMLALGPSSDSTDAIKKSMENNVAAVGNAEASADGIKIDVQGITLQPIPDSQPKDLGNLISYAPKDAAIVFSADNWDKCWIECKKQLSATPEMKSQIQQASSQAKQTLKFDPFADLLDRITMLGGYYTPSSPARSNSFPGQLSIVLGIDKPLVVKKALNCINAAIVNFGQLKMKSTAYASSQISSFPIENGSVWLSDAIVGDKLIFNISGNNPAEFMKNSIMVIQNKKQNLSSTRMFKSVCGQLPKQASGIFYGDASALAPLFKSQLPANDYKKTQAVLKHVSALGVTTNSSGQKYELRAVLPFK